MNFDLLTGGCGSARERHDADRCPGEVRGRRRRVVGGPGGAGGRPCTTQSIRPARRRARRYVPVRHAYQTTQHD